MSPRNNDVYEIPQASEHLTVTHVNNDMSEILH